VVEVAQVAVDQQRLDVPGVAARHRAEEQQPVTGGTGGIRRRLVTGRLPDAVEQRRRRRVKADGMITDVELPAQRRLDRAERLRVELAAIALVEAESAVGVRRPLRVALADAELKPVP
jgi:hypothetical protein